MSSPAQRNQPRANRRTFALTWTQGPSIPERDDAQPLCIYCNTDPQTPQTEPYCSDVCAISARTR